MAKAPSIRSPLSQDMDFHPARSLKASWAHLPWGSQRALGSQAFQGQSFSWTSDSMSFLLTHSFSGEIGQSLMFGGKKEALPDSLDPTSHNHIHAHTPFQNRTHRCPVLSEGYVGTTPV